MTGYVVEYRESDGVAWQRGASVDGYARTATVHGLREGREYLFRVHAVNEHGRGEWLEMDVALRSVKYTGQCWSFFIFLFIFIYFEI